MFTTILIVLLLIAAVVCFVISRRTKKGAAEKVEAKNARIRERNATRAGYQQQMEEEEPVAFTDYLPTWVGVVPLILALLFAVFSCTAIVQAKTQGVLLTFGKPAERTLDPGLNLKAPWQKVVTVDTTRQTDNYNDGKEDTDHSVIKVRLGNGNVSALYASITWQVNDEKANTVYGEFRGDDPTEEVYKKLVAPNFKQAVNSTLGQYNPVADIKAQDGSDSGASAEDAAKVNFAPDFDAFAADVKSSFEERIQPADGSAPLIKVISVQTSFIDFDDATEQQIADYQAEVQKTVIAAQAVQTAIKQAEANEKIAASISKDPNVLASRCLDLIAEGKFDPPIGFSCYPGGSGQSTGVIVDSSK